MSAATQLERRQQFWRAAGEELTLRRQRRAWTPVELATRAGVLPTMLRNLEAGAELVPSLEAILALTTALGIDLMAFLAHCEQQAGTRLIAVTPPGQTGGLAPRVASSRGVVSTDQLEAALATWQQPSASAPRRPLASLPEPRGPEEAE